MPKMLLAAVFPDISGLTLSRPALPRRKEFIIITLIIGVTLIITIDAITKKLTLFRVADLEIWY
jgi:hypothetical protein